MTRTILGIATALLAFATLSAPSAQACISCEYTPEVVTKGLKSQPKTYAKKRVVTPSKEIAAARAAKARMAKAAQASKAVETAKVEDSPKTVASEAKQLRLSSVRAMTEPNCGRPKRLDEQHAVDAGELARSTNRPRGSERNAEILALNVLELELHETIHRVPW